MSRKACGANQVMAVLALELVMSGEIAFFNLTDQQTSRLLVCGECPDSDVDGDRAKVAFRLGVDALVHKIDRYQEWGPDPELAEVRTKERRRAYRDRNQGEIVEREKNRRVDLRIIQLKAKLEGRNHD